MLIDCDTCAAPASACHGCVMTVLLRRGVAGRRPGAGDEGGSGASLELDDAERAAIATLAGAGLVPPLRLVRAVTDVSDQALPAAAAASSMPGGRGFRGIA